MKLLYFDDFKLGVLKGESVVDVSAVVQDIPHIGPHDLISGLIARFGEYRGKLEAAVAKGSGVPVTSVRVRPPDPQALQHRRHGRELHGGRHPHRAGPDQRVPQVARQHHRPRRHHGAARRPRHHLRGRGRDGHRHRQARQQRAGGRRHELHLRLHELHRRLGAGPAAGRQRVLPDEVARHLLPHRPVPGHRRRDRRPAPPADQAVGQRAADAELQHRRHGPQDPQAASSG